MNILDDKSRGTILVEAEHVQREGEPRRAIVAALKDWRGLIGFLCGAVAIWALLAVTP